MGLSHQAGVYDYELHSPDQDGVRINKLSARTPEIRSVHHSNSEPLDASGCSFK
jgi:hypothetical protein